MPNIHSIRYAVALAVALIGVPLWLAAQEPTGGPAATGARSPAASKGDSAAPPTPAESFLDEAITKLKNRPYAAADITLQADMLNERFRVVGQYLKAPDYRMLLRLSVEGLADAQGTTQQICDGTTVYSLTQAYDEQRISLIRLAPLLKALDNPDADQEFREAVLSQLGFSGPDALLQGLRQVAVFDLGMKEDEYEGHPVYVLRGQWKDRQALGMPGGPNAPGVQIGFLPPYVPSQIGLWVDRESGWPHKLVMEGKIPTVLKEEQILDPTGHPIARKPASMRDRPSRLTLTYALTDRDVASEEFQFRVPESARVEDLTDRMAAALDAQISDIAARRRNQGATEPGNEPIEPLNAPRPDATPAPAPGRAPAQEPPKASNPEK
jgi:hypothetical protein